MEFQSANLCFLNFVLAVGSYLEASQDKTENQRHGLEACGSLNISLLLSPPAILWTGRKKEGEGKWVCILLPVVSKRKKLLANGKRSRKPWSLWRREYHSWSSYYIEAEGIWWVSPPLGAYSKFTHFIGYVSKVEQWLLELSVPPLTPGSYFPTYLRDTTSPSSCLGPLPSLVSLWRFRISYSKICLSDIQNTLSYRQF